jgi:hypothetical protein
MGSAPSLETKRPADFPDVPVDWSYGEALLGRDNQLSKAVQVAQKLG